MGSRMICPYCDHENIEGADTCEQCQQSLNDLNYPMPASEIEKSLVKDRIGVLHPKASICVEPSEPVSKVLQLLVDRQIGCVVVAEQQRPVGIFSERDALLRLNADALQYADRPVSDFMTPSPQTLQMDAKIAFAVQRMDLGEYRHLPIVDREGQLSGIISVRDILEYLTERMS